MQENDCDPKEVKEKNTKLTDKGKFTSVMLRSIILPVVLYGCETWSLTLREKHSLRVFENRVLRRIFGPKRDEVTEEWRKFIMRSFVICTLRQV
jgi:hypothetical protein